MAKQSSDAKSDFLERKVGFPPGRTYEEKLDASPISKLVRALDTKTGSDRVHAYFLLTALIGLAGVVVFIFAVLVTCSG